MPIATRGPVAGSSISGAMPFAIQGQPWISRYRDSPCHELEAEIRPEDNGCERQRKWERLKKERSMAET